MTSLDINCMCVASTLMRAILLHAQALSLAPCPASPPGALAVSIFSAAADQHGLLRACTACTSDADMPAELACVRAGW